MNMTGSKRYSKYSLAKLGEIHRAKGFRYQKIIDEAYRRYINGEIDKADLQYFYFPLLPAQLGLIIPFHLNSNQQEYRTAFIEKLQFTIHVLDKKTISKTHHPCFLELKKDLRLLNQSPVDKQRQELEKKIISHAGVLGLYSNEKVYKDIKLIAKECIKPPRNLKQELLNKYKLDETNQDHMRYWGAQVVFSGSYYKGYYLPKTVKNALITINKYKIYPYHFFLQKIQQTLSARSYSMSSLFMCSFFFRSPKVQELKETQLSIKENKLLSGE